MRLGSGCKAAFDLLLFPRVPLRYALPWAVAGLLHWLILKRSSTTRPAAAAYPLRVKERKVNATTTPTTSAPSATGQQLQKPQKRIACRSASPNRSRHRYAGSNRAKGHRTGTRPSGLFFWTVHGPFSFQPRRKGAPAAPRAVGKGSAPKPTEWARKCPWGAGERAQFSHRDPRHACVVGRAGAAKGASSGQ